MMRRKIIALCIILSTLSCSKSQEIYQTVTFRCSIEEHSMTKAIDHAAVKELIASKITGNIKPYFYYGGDTSQATRVEAGTETTMKVGTYAVKWDNGPLSIVKVVSQNMNFSKAPLFKIDEEVTITPGVSEYTLSAAFHSFAIVVDATEISAVQYYAIDGTYKDIDFFVDAGTDGKMIFINGDFAEGESLQLKLIPSDATRKETTIAFASTASTGIVAVSSGKYYTIHPDAVTEVGSLFNVTVPEWSCGDEE